MNNSTEDLYLVPFDFTSISERALDYALRMALTGGGKVMVIHIVKDHDDVAIAKIKLDQKIGNHRPAELKILQSNVVVGSIFSDIGKTAESTSASIIVMGSHGAVGLQKILGSHALKIVSSSVLPFLVVHSEHKTPGLENIVLPFSFARESVQIVEFASSLALKFGSKLHLVGYRDKDEWLARDMKTNEVVVRKHLAKCGVNYELVAIPAGSNYEKELLAYAHKIDADLIAAAYFSTGIKDLFHKFIQEMLDNEYGIPVLTVNAVEVMAVNSNYSFLTV